MWPITRRSWRTVKNSGPPWSLSTTGCTPPSTPPVPAPGLLGLHRPGQRRPGDLLRGSADATLAWLLEENEDPDSVFYQRVDADHLGLSGHSQGGVGVFNAVSEQPHGEMYTCAVELVPHPGELGGGVEDPL